MISVIDGSSAFGTACLRLTRSVTQAFGPGGEQVVGVQLVDQRGPHHQRVLGQVDERQHEAGQREVPEQVAEAGQAPNRRP